MDTFQADSHLEGAAKNTHPEDLAEVMDFSGYDLFTTVRLIVSSGESRKIQVKKGGLTGSMFIKEGEIYCVETVDRHGDRLSSRLSLEECIPHRYQEADPPESNVRISTSVLLDLMKAEPDAMITEVIVIAGSNVAALSIPLWRLVRH
jgi:hypothetical protein